MRAVQVGQDLLLQGLGLGLRHGAPQVLWLPGLLVVVDLSLLAQLVQGQQEQQQRPVRVAR